MQRLFAILFSTVALCAVAIEPNSQEELSSIQQTWNSETALKKAFREQGGWTEEQLDLLAKYLWSKTSNENSWPFADVCAEYRRSVHNPSNENAAAVADAISQAGGDLSVCSSFTEEVRTKVANLLANKDANAVSTGGSLLEMHASSRTGDLTSLSGSMTMLAGNVGTNTQTLSSLSNTAAASSLAIAELGTSIGAMSTVTNPTIQLATSMGVGVETVASLALAGSFIGPMLGVIAIVYVAWPEEDIDPWMLVEARVAKALSARFDTKRRKQLGDRMRRYIKQFSRCSQAWVSGVMTNVNGVTVPRWLVADAAKFKQMIHEGGNFSFDSIRSDVDKFPAPKCMAQLEGHMSIERDDWYDTDSGSFSGLFMPFANMHTQILNILADNPFDQKMQWGATLQATSAEYGNYMLTNLLSSWKAQACRSMRLRQSMSGITGMSWKYQYVAMTVVNQPNAGKDCSEQCGSESGWCAFCGGKNDGACCKAGDKGVCARFDTPLTYYGAEYQNCVHTDCIQSNSGYYGTEVKQFKENAEGGAREPLECQGLCQSVEGAVAFRLDTQGKSCTCLAKGPKPLTRNHLMGAFSGPMTCKNEQSLEELEDKLEGGAEENTKVPMDEVEACEKSPSVSNFAEAEEKNPDWVKGCLTKVTKVLIGEYNTFYLKFGKFVDSLAWKAGCGRQNSIEWVRSARGDNYLEVSKEFDAGSFADCNWKKEEKHDEGLWMFDETRARGWTGTSKVTMAEQSTTKLQYPMPAWLRDLRNTQDCLVKTGGGSPVEHPEDGRNAAVGTILEPTIAGRDL